MSEENSFELTDEDIQKLIKSPFDKKIDVTKKIADYYKQGGFDQAQMMMAAKIFGTLVKDAEVSIRKALSEAIKDQPDIPHDIVMALAQDVHDVSLPVLEFSEVLSDIDLIEIVQSTQDVEKQKSISKREGVSEQVSDVLIETNSEEVVATLLDNETSNVSEQSYDKIVEEYKDNEKVMETMIQREALPITVIEILTDRISTTIQKKLADRNPEAFSKIEEVAKRSGEMAAMKIMGMKSTDAEYAEFRKLMDKLRISNDLAPIYALCMANIGIFEVIIARMTQTPLMNVRTLVTDSSNRGFEVLYERSDMPEGLYNATKILITVLRRLNAKYGSDNKEQISAHLEQALKDEVPHPESIANFDYIMSLVSHYAVN